MNMAWRLNGHNLTEEELILGNCLYGNWPAPMFISGLADEVADFEYVHCKEGRALIKKLQRASFADVVAVVERLGF